MWTAMLARLRTRPGNRPRPRAAGPTRAWHSATSAAGSWAAVRSTWTRVIIAVSSSPSAPARAEISRCWLTISRSEAAARMAPTTWPTRSRTVHRAQSVGRSQPEGRDLRGQLGEASVGGLGRAASPSGGRVRAPDGREPWSWSWGLLGRGRRDAGVVAEQVDGLVEQACPAVAAGVVGDLLVGEAGERPPSTGRRGGGRRCRRRRAGARAGPGGRWPGRRPRATA